MMPEDLGDLLDLQAAEDLHFDDPRGLPLVLARQRRQGLVDAEDLQIPPLGQVPTSPSIESRRWPPPRLPVWRPRAWSTRMRRMSWAAKPKKCAWFCQVTSTIHQTQIDLVHESRGLERMPRVFSVEVAPGHPAQLVEDQGA